MAGVYAARPRMTRMTPMTDYEAAPGGEAAVQGERNQKHKPIIQRHRWLVFSVSLALRHARAKLALGAACCSASLRLCGSFLSVKSA